MAPVRARYLIDKSALARMPLEPVRRRLAPIIEAGDAATCAIIDLEVLFSARNGEDHEKIRQRRSLAYISVPFTEEILKRAIAIQGELAKTGRHRVPIPDLLIAATGETAGLTILHYDSDFELIASITGQPVEWVVPRGSV
jgi:predicted nucleic acid-binding protein